MPNIFHGLLILALSMLPFFSGGWGVASSPAALSATTLILFGVVVALAINEYLIKISSMDWEHLYGRWKIVLPITAALVMGNLLGPEGTAQGVVQATAFGLIGLTAMRTQRQTDVLMRLGIMAAIAVACWGMAGKSFFLVVPLVFLIALQMTYDPPEPRAYLSASGHGQLILFVLLLSTALLIGFLAVGALLQWMGVDLNAASNSATQIDPAEKLDAHWSDFVMLALLAYFGVPYLLRLFNKKEKANGTVEIPTESTAPRIAEQFKRVLGHSTPRERVIYAYHEMLKAMIKLGFVHDAALTPQAIGRLLIDQRQLDPTLCQVVNRLFYRACYSKEAITEEEATQMEEGANSLVAAYHREK